MDNNQHIRKSRMKLNEVYFWTDTIIEWKHLLENDYCKFIVIDSWRMLVRSGKIKIYGFVIMPNHLHVIWEMVNMNGKEMPHASFNKFTSHQFLKYMTSKKSEFVNQFRTWNNSDRNHRFWRRDPLAIHMDSTLKVEQKLDYIHLNPLQEKWCLVSAPEDYKWSSAKYYEQGIDEFGFLTDYREIF